MCSFDTRTRGSTRLSLRMKQGIEITRAVEDQSAFIPEERTSELGRIIEKDEGCSMRIMKTTPAASLDPGKGQGNHSSDARSWGLSQAIYCEGGRKRVDDRLPSNREA